MYIFLIILNFIALIVTTVWAIRSNALEPIAGIFVLIGTLLGLILKSIKPKLKIFYVIQQLGRSRLSGGPWRVEFDITLGLENKNIYKSATNVNLSILSETNRFDPYEARSLSINPKAKLEILRSKRYMIIENSRTYNNIIIDYEVSASEIKTIQKTLVITGNEIIEKVL